MKQLLVKIVTIVFLCCAALPSKSQEEVISNGVTPSSTATTVTSTTALHTPLLPPSTTTRKSSSSKVESNNCSNTERGAEPNKQKHNNVTAHTVNTDIDDYQYIEQAPSTVAPPMQCKNRHNNLNDCADENLVNEHSASKTYKASNGITTTTKTAKLNKDNVVTAAASSGRKGKSTNTSAATAAANSFMNNKDEVIVRSVLLSSQPLDGCLTLEGFTYVTNLCECHSALVVTLWHTNTTYLCECHHSLVFNISL